MIDMNSMTDRCHQLRRLHSRLVDELNSLKESEQEEEQEGVENPLEMLNIIKSLQRTLNTITLELEKCPSSE
jgi:hypothetical protein